ncbi:Eukaryotic translation initiation factor 4B [Heterocephalus glaber]|uniref:Eukaryotic translation initiation factor 4B n=1 Tax=Heterocephalus glaber TaxID=10181 RepID=G5B0C0_HETGA|nr:Eukaryotic translation initiation factor 4B [Heterocephalus glaber]
MVASVKKKNKKGKSISLQIFWLRMKGLVEEPPMSPIQSAGLLKQMTWKEMFQPLGSVMTTTYTDSFDDYQPRRGDDSFGDKYQDRYDSDQYRDGYQDGPRWDTDLYGGRDRYDDRGSSDCDRAYDSRIGSGRRAFGRGYCRDDDYRGGGDCYEDRYDRWDDRPRDDYSLEDYRRHDRGPPPKTQTEPKASEYP